MVMDAGSSIVIQLVALCQNVFILVLTIKKYIIHEVLKKIIIINKRKSLNLNSFKCTIDKMKQKQIMLNLKYLLMGKRKSLSCLKMWSQARIDF